MTRDQIESLYIEYKIAREGKEKNNHDGYNIGLYSGISCILNRLNLNEKFNNRYFMEYYKIDIMDMEKMEKMLRSYFPKKKNVTISLHNLSNAIDDLDYNYNLNDEEKEEFFQIYKKISIQIETIDQINLRIEKQINSIINS